MQNKIFGVNIKVSKNILISFEIVPLFMSDNFQVYQSEKDNRKETLALLHKISLPLNKTELNCIYYKKGKQHLKAIALARFHLIRQKGFKMIFYLLRWFFSDETLRMLFSSFLKINIPSFILVFKNKIFIPIIKQFITKKRKINNGDNINAINN